MLCAEVVREVVRRDCAQRLCAEVVRGGCVEDLCCGSHTGEDIKGNQKRSKEINGNEAKVIGFSAKRARGMMARYMIQNRIDQPEGLKDFAEEGYEFQPTLSSDSDYIFTRVIN